MGFPIKKKRINASVSCSAATTPSGLDILSAAIDSCRVQPVHSPSCYPEDAIVSTTSVAVEECSSITSDKDSEICSATPKRAKTFPEVLMEILSNPDYASYVGWLPNGKSFSIYNPSEFSSRILPKYFRRVIFRSFVRKLNRWGFRSVKRSVSGFESTFEHKHFSRDDPELCAKLFCKSNPTSKVAVRRRSNSANSNTASNTVSPSNSARPPAAMNPSPQQGEQRRFMSSFSQNEEFKLQLSSELVLIELQKQALSQQRQQAMLNLAHQMPMADSDVMSQYISDSWRLMLLSQQQHRCIDGYNSQAGI